MSGARTHSTMIDGFGDDFITAFSLTVTLFITLVFLLQKYYFSSQRINPANEENVQRVRENLSNNRFESGGNIARLNENSECTICLSPLNLPVETNCGHIFCSSCIISYWALGNWGLSCISCPICRQRVTILLGFQNNIRTPDNLNNEERERLLSRITNYNRRFSGQPRSIMEYIRDIPALLRHLWLEFFTVQGLAWTFRIRVIMLVCFGIFYFLSPFDLIPESIFGIFGVLDDIFAILILCLYLSIYYRTFVSSNT